MNHVYNLRISWYFPHILSPFLGPRSSVAVARFRPRFLRGALPTRSPEFRSPQRRLGCMVYRWVQELESVTFASRMSSSHCLDEVAKHVRSQQAWRQGALYSSFGHEVSSAWLLGLSILRDSGPKSLSKRLK